MDYDLIVIGSGPGGYVAAIRAAQLGLKTACVEKGPLGGTCLNVGCIPSKSLLQSSEFYYRIAHHSEEHGISATPTLDFGKMMERKQNVIKGFNSGIAGLFQKNKVTSITGHATFEDPHTILVEGKKYTASHFIIATGSEPMPLPFLPFDEKQIISSTGALALPAVPKKLTVVGAGIIGVELGSVYSRLGAEVTFVEFMDRVCPPLDGSLSRPFQKILEKQGMRFYLSHKVVSASGTTLHIEGPEKPLTLEADTVLVAIGRKPYTDNLGLDKLPLTLDRGKIPISDRFQTAIPHIYAIGDVVDGPMLAHKAEEEGIAAAELIAGQNPHLDYMAIPSVVYTDPEIGAVGLTEEAAKSRNLAYNTAKFSLKANSRAQCMGEGDGFVKMISDKGTDRLLGCHILGPHAGELIAEAALAIRHRLTALDLAETCHAHPTLSEAVKECALALHKRAIHS